MARGGKPEVTLTFGGDSDQLERAFDRVGAAAKGLEGDLSKVGDDTAKGLDKIGISARDMERDLDRAGMGAKGMGDDLERAGAGAREFEQDMDSAADRARRLDRVIGEGGRGFGEYGRGLGGVGDRFDEVDTRAMGAADGFAGLTDAMRWNQLTAQEQAMVFSDMGSSMYNLVIPSLQDGAQKLRSFSDGLKTGEGAGGAFRRNLGNIAVATAGAAAAAGLLTMHFTDQAQRTAEARQRAAEFTDALRAADGNARQAGLGLLQTSDSYDRLRESLSLAGVSTEEFASQAADGSLNVLQMAEAASLSDGETLSLIIRTGEYTAAQERAAEATANQRDRLNESTDELREYGDALRAQFDPLFAMIDAQRDSQAALDELRFAQLGLDAAIREHGPNSLQAAEAQRTLTDAQDRARNATIDLEGAATTLRAEIQAGNVNARDARNQFIQMAVAQGYTKGEARSLARQFGVTTEEARRLGGQRPQVRTSAPGARSARDALFGVRDAADRIPARKTIQVEAQYRGAMSFLTGTIFGKRAMGGPVSGGKLYEVGEQDKSELFESGGHTYLIPGSDGRVIPADDMAAGGGMGMGAPPGAGTTINIYVQGSIQTERDFLKTVRDEFDRLGFQRSVA